MTFSFIQLDPRRNADQLLSEEWKNVLGVEVTVPALAGACARGNIDPQHGQHRGRPGWPAPAGEAAVAFATRIPAPNDGSILATVRPDVDSIGAMAVLVLRSLGTTTDHLALPAGPFAQRVAQIAASDAFTPGAAWAPRSLPTTANLWPTTAAPASETRNLAPLGVICSPAHGQPRHAMSDRVFAMACWLLWGQPDTMIAEWGDAHLAAKIAGPSQAIDSAVAEAGPMGPLLLAREMLLAAEADATRARRALAYAIEIGAVAPRLDSTTKIAVVESTHIGAIGLGYCIAPIVVAAMPATTTGARKYTIAAWSAALVDFAALASTLAGMEPGWGGGASILGSPQGAGSLIELEAVLAVVRLYVSA